MCLLRRATEVHHVSMLVVSEFSKHYHKLADGELLLLARQRVQLAPAASAALDAELLARGLGPEAIREFEDQSRVNLEPQTADASEELPPPIELPDDWFDEDAGAPTTSALSSRPKGVTICALLFWLSGVLMAGWGALMFSGSPQLRSLVIGMFAMILGVVQCVSGCGLWWLTLWGRKSAELLCWFFVALASLSIVVNAYTRLRGIAVDVENAIWPFVGLLWQLLWAIYLRSQSTRHAFLPAEQKSGSRRASTR